MTTTGNLSFYPPAAPRREVSSHFSINRSTITPKSEQNSNSLFLDIKKAVNNVKQTQFRSNVYLIFASITLILLPLAIYFISTSEEEAFKNLKTLLEKFDPENEDLSYELLNTVIEAQNLLAKRELESIHIGQHSFQK